MKAKGRGRTRSMGIVPPSELYKLHFARWATRSDLISPIRHRIPSVGNFVFKLSPGRCFSPSLHGQQPVGLPCIVPDADLFQRVSRSSCLQEMHAIQSSPVSDLDPRPRISYSILLASVTLSTLTF